MIFKFNQLENKFEFKFNRFRLSGKEGEIIPKLYEDIFEYINPGFSLQVLFYSKDDISDRFKKMVTTKVEQMVKETLFLEHLLSTFPETINKSANEYRYQ